MAFGQSVSNVVLFVYWNLYFMIIYNQKRKEKKMSFWWKRYSVNQTLLLPFFCCQPKSVNFLNLGTIVVKWLSLCNINQRWLLAQWQEWSQILNGLVSIVLCYFCSTKRVLCRKGRVFRCLKGRSFGVSRTVKDYMRKRWDKKCREK